MTRTLEIMQAAAQAGLAIVPSMAADKSMPTGADTPAVFTFTAEAAQPTPFFG